MRQVVARAIGDRSELWNNISEAYRKGHCYSDFCGILYPSLRIDTLQVKVESMGSVPPGLIGPLGMQTLDLQIESDLCPDGAAKGESLTEFASQLTVDPF